MADGRHRGKVEKQLYLRNGLTDRHEIWHDDTHWASEPYRQVAFRTFKNPRWRNAAILKNRKGPYLRNGLTDQHKI